LKKGLRIAYEERSESRSTRSIEMKNGDEVKRVEVRKFSVDMVNK